LLVVLFALTVPARSEVRLPDGEYFEAVVDLRVKVMGGHVTVQRTWFRDQWYFSPAWATLKFKLDSRDGSVESIDRAGWIYTRSGQGAYVFDSRNRILTRPGGYRWQDKQGNWIDYDGTGKIVQYGDRNDVKVSFTYDSSGRLAGVLDHFGTQILWYEYDGDRLSGVRDYAGRRVRYRYTGNQLTEVADILGHTWSYAYTGAGRLASRTDPEGRKTRIDYAGNGRVAAITQPDGSRTTYAFDYDSGKRLLFVRITYPSGAAQDLWYDLQGRVVRRDLGEHTYMSATSDNRSLTRANLAQASVREDRDEWNNLVKRTYPDGSSDVYEREPRFSRVSKHVDGNGNVTLFEHDDKGNLIRMREAAGRPETRTTEFRFDAYGNVLSEKRLADAVSAAAEYVYTYDQYGNRATSTDPEGGAVSMQYDAQGEITRFTDARGNVWNHTRNAAGWLLETVDPLGRKTSFTYDKVGNLVELTDRRGKVTRFEYDSRNRRTARIAALGNRATAAFDSDGHPSKIVDESGVALELAIDPLWRVQRLGDGRGNTVSLTYPSGGLSEQGAHWPYLIDYPTFRQELRYDVNNRLAQIRSLLASGTRVSSAEYDRNGNLAAAIDEAGNRMSFQYDGLDRLIKTVDRLGHVVTLAYDNRDNLIAVTDANGHTRRFEYDLANRQTRERMADGAQRSYAYDAADNPVEFVDANGRRTENLYDKANRLIQTRHYEAGSTQPAKTVAFSYDDEDNLTGWEDGALSAARAYDDLNRLLSETVNYGPFSLTYSYTYHPNGRIATITCPGGTTLAYSYSSHDELAVVAIPGEGSVTVNDFLWTRPSRVTLPGGVTQASEYDPWLSLTRATTALPSGSSLVTLENAYGTRGELQSKTLDGMVTSFTYDREVRLTQATSAAVTEAFEMDPAGNRIRLGTGSEQWQYDERNRLLAAAGVTYEYDNEGNLVRRTAGGQATNLAYDTTNRLVRVEDGAGTVIARYGYDPFGRRLWKQAAGSTTFFLYSDEGLLGEYSALGDEIAAYAWRPGEPWGTNPLFLRRGGNYFYYHNDQLGTPLRLTDRNGGVVWSAGYDAFGAGSVSAGSTLESNLRLPGQYFDAETGLHYNFQRYYDPRIGRYYSPDPAEAEPGASPYAYARNDPANAFDPTGEVVWFIAPIVGGLVGAGIDFAWQMIQNGGNLSCVNWGDVALSGAIGAGLSMLGPSGVVFGRAGSKAAQLGYRGGFLNRGNFRIGWSWHNGRNWFGVHGGKPFTPSHWHRTPIPGPRGHGVWEFGFGGGAAGGAIGAGFGSGPDPGCR
jgi:RHS repeat-associated protein